MELLARDRRIQFPRRPLIMGIVNINDDSFCEDGRVDFQWALEKACGLVAQGADIIDVGAESARTNRPVITPEEEFDRLKRLYAAWSARMLPYPADARSYDVRSGTADRY